jgi:alkylation response protein AidB-like acyl-CoA dehydrogenase
MTEDPEKFGAEIRKEVQAWLRRNLPPNKLTALEDRRAWHKRLHSAGYFGITWPTEYGGQGLGAMRQAIVEEELARADAPTPLNQAGIEVAGPSILLFGSDAQKSQRLGKLLSADELWCQLYSEPGAGSDLASLRTFAERKGDRYFVTGQKLWTSEGAWADFGILLARTDRAELGRNGISCFILNMRQTGVTVRPLVQITGSEHFCEVFLDEAEISITDRIGAEGEGWTIATKALSYERGGNSLARIARYQRALNALVAILCKLNSENGSAVPHPAALTALQVEIEIHRLNALSLLSKIEAGEDIGVLSSIHKLSYSEFERRMTNTAQTLLGPWGRLTSGREMAELAIGTSSGEAGTWAHETLWARAVTIFAGTSEIQRNIIANRGLSLPRQK